jgi:hypothetical protein
MCYFVPYPTHFLHRVQSEIQGLTLAPNVELKEEAVKYSLYMETAA